MPIEQFTRPFCDPLGRKEKTRQLEPGEKGRAIYFGKLEVVSDSAIRSSLGFTLKGNEINQARLRSLRMFPPRSGGYRYKPSNEQAKELH